MNVTPSRRIPAGVLLALVWVVVMLAVALCAEWLRPYGITQMDLRARLRPPAGFGGVWEHALGTDELGRDVLSRLIVSIRISVLIAFGATAIAAVLGTTLGFLAAHFRGLVEQAVLMMVDFQASMPFLIIALAVLAFFGNSLPLFIGLMGFYGWERHARIARGLAIAANAQGYAAAVHQLGAGPWRIYARHILPNIAATLIVAATLGFPGLSRDRPLGVRTFVSWTRGAAADDVAREHGRVWARIYHARTMDPVGAKYHDRPDDAGSKHSGRLVAGSAGPDAAVAVGGQGLPDRAGRGQSR
jgi:ABC-type dipeptide/oligopeptide/nickel transport system permease subunit